MNIKLTSTLLLFYLGISLTAFTQQLPSTGLCAHRGAMDTHPENTIPAFKAAIEAGAQMIEFDVWLTKDNKMVIIHDETVDRTTNGTGEVSSLTFEEIRKLDAGSWKLEEFSGVQIPTLEEVLDIMPYNVWLNIHIKQEGDLPVMIAQTVKEKGRLHQSFLACTRSSMQKVRKAIPEILFCNMDRKNTSDKYVDQTISSRANFLQFPKKGPVITPAHIAKLKSNAVLINYFQADSLEEAKQLLVMGVDFPLVNNIVEFMQHADELQLTPIKPVFSAE
ncbi:glycerophosphodiester phosphodiesterase [Chondrinema litorale]|uniref:glycerophosphodiester phosphodiesterase n=1 Tax=Chondrinema litorale TaxID=2994555 RepID=UPI0025433806|nr:glycerophosphodiester phosphodiesterase family protein [Chondrinema litorale]UZR97754.1 glycerophosphodiester phosphodiesterase family protein [Chondrinema litorale]